MKKEYSTPTAEKLEFDYSETVVASTGTTAANKSNSNQCSIPKNKNAGSNCSIV